MVGDELPLTTMTSTTMTMKASATTGTHRARYRERLAGGTAVKLPRGWARAGGVGGSCRERHGPLPWRQATQPLSAQKSGDEQAVRYAPGEIRTPDLRFRRPMA